jgi:hypothetical protein
MPSRNIHAVFEAKMAENPHGYCVEHPETIVIASAAKQSSIAQLRAARHPLTHL